MRLLFIGTCEWGNCGRMAVGMRFSLAHGWLPVCRRHIEP